MYVYVVSSAAAIVLSLSLSSHEVSLQTSVLPRGRRFPQAHGRENRIMHRTFPCVQWCQSFHCRTRKRKKVRWARRPAGRGRLQTVPQAIPQCPNPSHKSSHMGRGAHQCQLDFTIHSLADDNPVLRARKRRTLDSPGPSVKTRHLALCATPSATPACCALLGTLVKVTTLRATH